MGVLLKKILFVNFEVVSIMRLDETNEGLARDKLIEVIR
jgi:hypothetical protein